MFIYLLTFSVGLYFNNNMATKIFPPNNTYVDLLHPCAIGKNISEKITEKLFHFVFLVKLLLDCLAF